MSYFARLRGRDSLRRPAPLRDVVEILEGRTMLSGRRPRCRVATHVSSTHGSQSSLTTAVTGSKVIFTATVENASTNAPIASGKVDFVVQSPKKIDLGTVSLSKQGQASVVDHPAHQDRRLPGRGQYIPTNPNISEERRRARHREGHSRAARCAHHHHTQPPVPPSPKRVNMCRCSSP